MRLWRIRSEDEPRYGHPNGWQIRRCTRDWSLRGFERGALGATEATAPKRWWEAHRSSAPRKRERSPEFTALTLREVRAWCDTHRWDFATREVVAHVVC